VLRKGGAKVNTPCRNLQRKFAEQSTLGDLTQISGFYLRAMESILTPGQGGFVRALQLCPVGFVSGEFLDKLYPEQYLQGVGDVA
jgi:hypothetical protein